MQVKISRNFILAELTRELYHNPAILDICEGDHMVCENEEYGGLLHDLDMIYARVLIAATSQEKRR